jgi:transposase InsO family protein
MDVHKNARLTPRGRALLVERAEQGGVRTAAEAFGVSPRTVRKWMKRRETEGAAGLQDRSSRPKRSPRALPQAWRELIAQLRRESRLTGKQIGERLQLARSTVANHLTRLGIGRLTALDPKPAVVRYQRAYAGELLHLDVKKLARFHRRGHRITGDRRMASDGAGWDFVHVAIDDATRLAYVEVLADERRATTTGFLVRALRWFRTLGVRVERVMSDNGSPYVSKLFRKACRWLGLKHIRTRPYTPKTNGKAERFIQTLMREWAYAIPFDNAQLRAADLPRWLDLYNRARPHSALGGRPPFLALSQEQRP